MKYIKKVNLLIVLLLFLSTFFVVAAEQMNADEKVAMMNISIDDMGNSMEDFKKDVETNVSLNEKLEKVVVTGREIVENQIKNMDLIKRRERLNAQFDDLWEKASDEVKQQLRMVQKNNFTNRNLSSQELDSIERYLESQAREIPKVVLNNEIKNKVQLLKDRNSNQVQLNNTRIRSRFNLSVVESENGSELRMRLSNGRNAEVKIMPERASELAIQRLKLKSEKRNESLEIELKEVGKGNATRPAYLVKAQKESKILGLFRANMDVETEIDAQSGEVISEKRPWWSFLAFK